jgi:hypothetical protein
VHSVPAAEEESRRHSTSEDATKGKGGTDARSETAPPVPSPLPAAPRRCQAHLRVCLSTCSDVSLMLNVGLLPCSRRPGMQYRPPFEPSAPAPRMTATFLLDTTTGVSAARTPSVSFCSRFS